MATEVVVVVVVVVVVTVMVCILLLPLLLLLFLLSLHASSRRLVSSSGLIGSDGALPDAHVFTKNSRGMP